MNGRERTVRFGRANRNCGLAVFELAHSVRRQLWVESGRQPPSLYSQYRIVTLPEVVSNHPPAE
jgi:hypothetical protein